jgi:formylmethanofuran dehydrogenase subunit E
LYNVICETAKCLPDAVQLLTPCSIGNRRLKIIDAGRYALTFYDKRTGQGVRIYMDHRRAESWPEVRDWYLKLKPKHMQDEQLLFAQIREAGVALFGSEAVVVDLKSASPVKKDSNSSIAICPSCNEAYRAADGAVCPACRGALLPYASKAVDGDDVVPVVIAR